MADYYMQQQIWETPNVTDFYEPQADLHTLYRAKKLHWETRDGERILVQDMSDAHIHNCIKMIKRRPLTTKTKTVIEIFELELRTRKP